MPAYFLIVSKKNVLLSMHVSSCDKVHPDNLCARSIWICERKLKTKAHSLVILSHKCLNLLFTLREKCPYSEFFWSVLSLVRTEYGEILNISPYLVQIRENTDQKNSEYGHFSRSVNYNSFHPNGFFSENDRSYNLIDISGKHLTQ